MSALGPLSGFFPPGESLPFTAGLFVASGVIATPLWLVCLLLGRVAPIVRYRRRRSARRPAVVS